jgi:hypothetical protein
MASAMGSWWAQLAPAMYCVMRDTMSGVSCTARGGSSGSALWPSGVWLCTGHYTTANLYLCFPPATPGLHACLQWSRGEGMRLLPKS